MIYEKNVEMENYLPKYWANIYPNTNSHKDIFRQDVQFVLILKTILKIKNSIFQPKYVRYRMSDRALSKLNFVFHLK